jgi:phage tail-like protein
MASDNTQSASSLLQYLPAIYHEDPFLGRFLLAFEKILLGRADGVDIPPAENGFPGLGLEESIAAVADYFDPAKTPEDFLPWLASWTAFSLRADLDADKQRLFIANIAQLYRWRGTKQNLVDLLQIFTVSTPTVVEQLAEGIQIGRSSTIGGDMYLGGDAPFYFQVKVSLPRAAPAVQERQLAIACALIELEKPAHTYYELLPFFPSMRIGRHSKVGVDTLLGTAQGED